MEPIKTPKEVHDRSNIAQYETVRSNSIMDRLTGVNAYHKPALNFKMQMGDKLKHIICLHTGRVVLLKLRSGQ